MDITASNNNHTIMLEYQNTNLPNPSQFKQIYRTPKRENLPREYPVKVCQRSPFKIIVAIPQYLLMNTRTQNIFSGHPSRTAMETFGAQETYGHQYSPYQAPYSYPKHEVHQPINNPQRVSHILQPNIYQQTKVNTIDPQLNQANQLKELGQNLRVAIQKVSEMITASQNELFNISNAKRSEGSVRMNMDRLIYLEKFQKDYQRLVGDLKVKKEFLEILLTRSANIEQFPSIDGWLNTINVKYIAELEKQLVFSEWKENLYKPESPIFRKVTENGKQDSEVMRKAKKGNEEGMRVNESKINRSEVNVNRSLINRDSMGLSLVDSQTLNNLKLSDGGNNVLRPVQQIRKTENRSSNIDIGSLLSSQDLLPSPDNYIMEYSDAYTVKTESFKRWVDQYCIVNDSFNNSVCSEEFVPANVVYNLGASYHPMTQSQRSNPSNPRDLLDSSAARSTRM